jgi:acid phosphatase family membrane protein YuiD
MNRFIDIFFNFPLVVSGIAWLIAQLLKTVVSIVTERRLNFVSLMASGGMPSSHSATVSALAISIGLTEGFASPFFAIAFFFAYIVMYDAAGVRRETGEQAKILNKILVDLTEGHTDEMPKQLKELVGHTPLQVFAGAVLGIAIAIAAKFIVYGTL